MTRRAALHWHTAQAAQRTAAIRLGHIDRYLAELTEDARDLVLMLVDAGADGLSGTDIVERVCCGRNPEPLYAELLRNGWPLEHRYRGPKRARTWTGVVLLIGDAAQEATR